MKILAAQATGADHRRLQEDCQDAWQSRLLGRHIVLSVADGMGSALHGGLGAKTACRGACSQGRAGVIRRMKRARRMLERTSGFTSIPLRQMGTTLMIVEMTADSIACAHVGDGGIVGWTGEVTVLLSAPCDSEACDVVEPLTASNWSSKVRVSKIPLTLKAVALFTDGLQRAALRKTATGWIPHEGFFRPLFQHLEQAKDSSELQAMLTGARLDSHTGDDRTLVMAML